MPSPSLISALSTIGEKRQSSKILYQRIKTFSLITASSDFPWGLPDGASGNEPTANTGDLRDVGLMPGSRRSLEEGITTHPSILGLENSTDREAWDHKESDTTEATKHAHTDWQISSEQI